MLRKEQIGNDDDRQLIFLRQVEGLNRRVKTVPRVARRDDDAGEVALRSSEDLIQVGLLGLRGDSRGRAAALYFNDHHGRFDHAGLADRFGHQREAASRSAAHRSHSGKARSDRDIGNR